MALTSQKGPENVGKNRRQL